MADEVRLSWIIFSCMVFYGAMRTTFWVRGQWRFRQLRGHLPTAAPPVDAPDHLRDGLGRLLATSYAGRARLVESVRTIATVLIIDPDVPLGVVRDFRYRVALADAWRAASFWLATWESLPETERGQLAGLGYDLHGFRERCAVLRRTVRTSVRAPALEPFAVADVAAAEGVVRALVEDLEGFERALLRCPKDDPYRA